MAGVAGDPAADRLAALVRQHLVAVPDHPQPGVVFQDITPLLGDAVAFAAVVDGAATALRASGVGVDLVAGVEARGFVLAAPLALRLGAGFVPVRKPGKLPRAVLSAAYGLEYGVDEVQVHVDAVRRGARVLVVDDVLATGGTAAAACDLVRRAGGEVVGVLVLLEIAALGGRERLADVDVRALCQV